MYRMLVGLMVLAALEQFGMTFSELASCRSRACLQKVQRHALDVLQIDWKPMSVWPEESKKFKHD